MSSTSPPAAAPSTAPRVTPYLNFDGTTREAMTFYQRCLGGELAVMTYADAGLGDGPDAVPSAMRDRVVNARLAGGALAIMASDAPPDAPPRPGTDVHLHLECADDAAVDQLFAALAEGGRATLPPHDAFWGARYAACTDRFGVQWMLHHGRGSAEPA